MQYNIIPKEAVFRLRYLSSDERNVILSTFVDDEVEHVARRFSLTPAQEMCYVLFRDYVLRLLHKRGQAQSLRS